MEENRIMELNNYILEKAKKANAVIIVGAGDIGRKMLNTLKTHKIYVKAFFDNNIIGEGQKIDDIAVTKPYKVKEVNCLYVIAVGSPKYRREMRLQLLELGIEMESIVACYCNRTYEYMSTLDKKYYEEELQTRYFECFGKYINLESPVTYNEKINWEKLNSRDTRRKLLADKYLVKDWAKDKIGEEHITKLYGVWDYAEDIDFDMLPDAFVLKVNNGSERNIFVKDKTKIDRKEICRQLNEWKEINYAYLSLELHYRDIEPKIICEEYLPGLADNVYDYNIYCFHGKPKYIWCIKGSHKADCKASFYSTDWEMQSFSFLYPKDHDFAPKPEKLDKMLELSEILCKDFDHVRVDWYNLPDGRVLFGEMTFSSGAGFAAWTPEEYDTIFGEMI